MTPFIRKAIAKGPRPTFEKSRELIEIAWKEKYGRPPTREEATRLYDEVGKRWQARKGNQ